MQVREPGRNTFDFLDQSIKSAFHKTGAFLSWLITPTVPIPQSDRLRQSRLLAALLLVFFGSGAAYLFFSLSYNYYAGDGNLTVSVVSIWLLGLAYFLNRAGYFTLSAWIAITFLSAAFFLMTFFTDGIPVDFDFLDYLILPLLVTSIFLAPKMILVLAAIYSGTMLIAGAVFLGYDPVSITGGPVFFVLIASGAIYIFSRQQSALEADRQQVLTEKEERYRTLLETSFEGICVLSQGIIVDANPGLGRLFGYDPAELVGEPLQKLIQGLQHPGFSNTTHDQNIQPHQAVVYRKDGSRFYIETFARMQTYRGKPALVVAIRDISERVQAEQALDQNERLYRSLFECANDAIFLLGFDETHKTANQKAAKLLGYTVEELVGKPISEVIAHHEFQEASQIKQALLSGEQLPPYERTFRKKDGSEFPVEINVSVIHDSEGQPLHIQSIVRDITERKNKEIQIQNQLTRLHVIRHIEDAITTNLDLEITLNVLLGQIVEHFDVDAVDILLYKPETQILEITARLGFRTEALQYTQLPLGQSYAGRAALDGEIVRIIDLAKTPGGLSQSSLLSAEDFHTYTAVPLLARGQIIGVLEIFNRRVLSPDPEWEDFLMSLAAQAAIAIDNAQLFQDAQRSTIELRQAYDATLAGWAKALELRDEETQGHSTRVTDLTVELGHALGITGDALTHLRRGAVLHDIGKMGIPDRILLKPGKLTDEEWETMRKHPQYAYDWLSPIAYLQPALAIPYSHHEKWDGTGYPQGLKGEQIPLPARIFSIIDVWDALNSDRPYRPRWPEQKVREYISSLAGIQFDPAVVSAFFDLLDRPTSA